MYKHRIKSKKKLKKAIYQQESGIVHFGRPVSVIKCNIAPGLEGSKFSSANPYKFKSKSRS